MSVDHAIARFRRREEAAFSSAVRVERRSGEGAFDPETGDIDEPDPEIIYEGAALVRSFSWEGTDVVTGDREVRLRGTRIKLPHDTPAEKDDVVIVTASRHDSDLVGRTYQVTDVLHDEWQVVRVVVAVEVTGVPEEEES